MIKICSIAFLSLLLSASSLFAQTKTFAGADYSQGIVFVMENNQMVWKHKAPDSNDLWILPNGNILFTTGHGVLEMTVRTIPFSIMNQKVRSLPANV